jgi:hypothetical protein
MDGAENACESGEVILCVADVEQTVIWGENHTSTCSNRSLQSIESARETLWNISAKCIEFLVCKKRGNLLISEYYLTCSRVSVPDPNIRI